MRRILCTIAPVLVLSCGGGGGSDTKPTQPVPTTPAITLSTSAASFTGASGAASPAAQNISISNGGTGTLSGLAAGAVVYGAGQPTGWLAVSIGGTTAPTTLTLTPAVGALLAGAYTASVPVTSTASGVTNSPQTVTASFTVTAGAATRVVFAAQPTVTTGGTINAPVSVAIQDAAGNIVTTATTNVTVSLGANASGATLGGTATVAAVAGVATFSGLSVSKTGTGYTLVAAATGLSSATSNAFNATVGSSVATQLAFTVQPSNVVFGAPITPAVQVAVRDGTGTLVATATNSITISIGTNPAGSTLSGTATASAVNGVATFNNLSLNNTGSGYTFTASSAGLTAATSSPFSVTVAATAVTLSVGQSAAFLTSPNFAAALSTTGGAMYLIGVVNTNAAAPLTEGFSLSGSFGLSALSQRAPVAPPPGPVRTLTAPSKALAKLPSANAARRARAKTHTTLLEANNRIYERAGNPRAAWASVRSRSGGVSPDVGAGISPSLGQTVGAVTKLYVGNSLNGGCSSVDSIGARTVAVGQHVIVLADTNLTKWPNQYRPDSSFYLSFAAEYDQITWPHLIANIGNPIGYDAQLSGVGKVSVVLTPVLNNLSGSTGGGIAVAYVSLCDFYPSHSAAIGTSGFSNQTEMMYSLVPQANVIGVTDWESELRATAAHESKHIVSFTDRILNNSPHLEQVWLEEGLANESSEIWERNFNQATFLGHATFAQTIACEVNLASSSFPCDAADNKPWALYFSQLPFLFDYLLEESTGNDEGLGVDSPANYGAGWAISRWVTDQYAAGNEGAFIKSLINEPTLNGMANLGQHTGQTVPLLLSYWNMASAIFQTPNYTAADVRVTYPSFNFADIFGGGQIGWTCGGVRCGFFTDNGLPPYPIQPLSLSTASPILNVVNNVPGTAASFYVLTAAATGVETLSLLTTTGAALSASSGLRMVILRVQ